MGKLHKCQIQKNDAWLFGIQGSVSHAAQPGAICASRRRLRWARGIMVVCPEIFQKVIKKLLTRVGICCTFGKLVWNSMEF